MPGTGTCACGNVAYKYSGDPALTALCHCSDCQKWSGSAFSSNVAVPTTNFSITKGTPKVWTRLALVSGKEHPHFFCGDCGSNLFSQPVGMPGTTLIQAGTLVDTNISIAAELFSTRRRDYVSAVADAQQADQMP